MYTDTIDLDTLNTDLEQVADAQGLALTDGDLDDLTHLVGEFLATRGQTV